MRKIALLALAGLLPVTSSALDPARWEGSIQIPGREQRVVVDLATGPDGKWSGSLIFPGYGLKGVPLVEIVVKDTEISFSVKDALAGQGIATPRFKGRLAADGALAGEFLQAGQTAPFRLLKAGPPQVEPLRQGTAVTKDFEGTWKGKYELLGYPRDVTLGLANQAGAASPANFVIVGKKTNQVPVDYFAINGDYVALESIAFGITFEGRLKGETGEIRGTFTQGPFELPLVLQRAKP